MLNVGNNGLKSICLHLVVAEDQEKWSETLQGLGNKLREWPFAKLGHFDLLVHACRTVEHFENLVEGLLSEGDLVYATLDLSMPLKEGENLPVSEAGERMILSCLRWKRQGHPVEFCLISELDDFLEKVHGESSELRKLSIRKLHKRDIEKRGGEKHLLDVVSDIQSFVRRHLKFSTVELPPGSGERVPIWFGGKEPLRDLLNRADQISGAEAGTYLLFAEAGGYEVDWVKLCCELRGLELTVFDIANADPEYDSNWRHPFRNPPEALLVRNVDQANDRRCDIAPLLDESFFEKVSQKQALVFFHFPLFETHLDVSKLDQAIEAPILEKCLSHIHRHHPVKPLQQGVSVFLEHPRIIIFPSYAALRATGVVQKTIELQAQESQRKYGCENVVIDPELFELLIEIPWNEKGGFPRLRNAIKGAYESFSSERTVGESIVREHHFRNSVVVAEESRGDLGFLVRGRRLYRLLETRDQSLVNGDVGAEKSSEAGQRLISLEILWQLYDGLHRLRDLRDDTLGHQPSDDTFTPQHYETLSRARTFLDNLFDSPSSLRRLIDIFSSHRKKKAWREYYPALADSRLAVVENIEFTWPFSYLPLHPAVFDYLQNNGVSPLIQDEIEENLQLYHLDLRAQWEMVKSERSRLRKEWIRREEERRAAIRYVQERHSQPVLVHLVPRVRPDEQPPPLQKVLTAFVLFNNHIALAENHYVFRGYNLVSKNVLREALDRVELGPMVNFLSQYAAALAGSEVGSRSIFHRWTDRWALEGKQSDAVRLARQVSTRMLSAPRYKRGWRKSDKNLLRKIASEESALECGIDAILNFFLIIRNAYLKEFGADFEQEYSRDLRDLMRRFLFATFSACSYRLGRVTDADRIDLWRKETGEQSEPADLVGNGGLWKERLVVARPASETGEDAAYEALFPIDDLVRLRPVEDSIWAYYSKGTWINLTYTSDSEEEMRLSDAEEADAEEEWLPKQETLTSSELWEGIHDE